jgi:hypothetical protein
MILINKVLRLYRIKSAAAALAVTVVAFYSDLVC